MLFSQYSPCHGLYLLLGGEFYRTAERREKRITLGRLQSGDLTELSAVLGDGTAHVLADGRCPFRRVTLPGRLLAQGV